MYIYWNSNYKYIYLKYLNSTQSGFVRWARWIVFIGIIVITITFGVLNLIARQNQIKVKFKRLSQGRFYKDSKEDVEMKRT